MVARNTNLSEYSFELIFRFDQEIDDDVVMHSLARAECTDALVGLGINRHISLAFNRSAKNAKSAISMAIKQVKKALPQATLVEVKPDYVGLTDAAHWLGMSRQNMRKIMIHHADQFPSAVHHGSTPIWHLFHITQFMKMRRQAAHSSVHELAQAAMQINVRRSVEDAQF